MGYCKIRCSCIAEQAYDGWPRCQFPSVVVERGTVECCAHLQGPCASRKCVYRQSSEGSTIMNAASDGRLTRPPRAGRRFRFVEVFAAASTSTRRFSRASQQGSEPHVGQVQCLPLCPKHSMRVGAKYRRVSEC